MEGASVGERERERQRCKKELGEEQEDVPARAHRGRCVDGLCGVVGFCVCFCVAWFGSACLLCWGVNVYVCLWWLCCTVLWCGVVGDGTGCAGTTAVRCKCVRVHIALRTTRSLLARLLHAHILLANPNSCDAFHCLQRIHNDEGGEMKISIFVCMSVCRFDVLLGGGGVGQEMVFEEWKEQV